MASAIQFFHSEFDYSTKISVVSVKQWLKSMKIRHKFAKTITSFPFLYENSAKNHLDSAKSHLNSANIYLNSAIFRHNSANWKLPLIFSNFKRRSNLLLLKFLLLEKQHPN
jgi:hypothetical protein